MKGVKRFPYLITSTAIVSLLISAGIAAWVDHENDKDAYQDCLRVVDTRNDNRTMWLYLIDIRPDADPKVVEEFTAELNKRLPVLECEDNNPVPADGSE